MDCAICFNPISNACILTCTHHFCYTCIQRWVNYKNTCPKCRAIIYDIKFDKEFDMLINKNSSPIIFNVRNRKQIEIQFPKGSNSGVTLKNKPPGVQVENINMSHQFFKSGIKVGDILLFINNIPCNNHSQVISIINNHQKSNKPLILLLK